MGDQVTLHRTDLALFDLDFTKRTVSCNLVEVKCCAQRLGLSGYSQLKERITQQINQSERILQRHFDPQRTTPDRPDRLLKTREIATLLDFYLERGLRYRLIEREAGEEARAVLDRLEDGYRLQFSRSGLIFDFDKPGTEPPEHEVDIEFHRIGVDLIHDLVNNAASMAPKRSPTSRGNDGGDGGVEGEATPEATLETLSSSSIPRLDTAAFLVEDRPRSTSDLDDEPWTRQDADAVRIEDTRKSTASDGSSHSMKGEPAATDSPASTPSGELPSPVDEAGPVDETSESELVARRAPVRSTPGTRAVVDETAESEPIARSVRSQPKLSPQPDLPARDTRRTSGGEEPECDSILGVTGSSPQYGLLGETSGRKIALDLNQTHTISLFGVQGGGKSYTVGSVVEMACMEVEGVNTLPHPLAGVIFHHSSTLDYRPEFASMATPNRSDAEVAALRTRYGAAPRALSDLVILAPAAKVEERRAEYPGIEVLPIAFAAAELKASHWKFLMGAVGSQGMYIRQLTLIMKKLRGKLTLAALRQGVQDSGLSDYLKELALLRLQFAEDYIDDAHRLTDILRPGRLVIVDLRDELIEKDEALGLFVVLLQMTASPPATGQARAHPAAGATPPIAPRCAPATDSAESRSSRSMIQATDSTCRGWTANTAATAQVPATSRRRRRRHTSSALVACSKTSTSPSSRQVPRRGRAGARGGDSRGGAVPSRSRSGAGRVRPLVLPVDIQVREQEVDAAPETDPGHEREQPVAVEEADEARQDGIAADVHDEPDETARHELRPLPRPGLARPISEGHPSVDQPVPGHRRTERDEAGQAMLDP